MPNKAMERTAYEALQAVAEQEGVSVESVRRDIELAVAAARQSRDPAVRAFWESIPSGMSAEDVISYFAQINLGKTN